MKTSQVKLNVSVTEIFNISDDIIGCFMPWRWLIGIIMGQDKWESI